MINVGIIDDNELFLNDFESHIIKSNGVQCLLKAKDWNDFSEYFKRNPRVNFDILFLDIKLERGSGLDLLPKIKKRLPTTDIIMLTVVEDENALIKSLCLGASGYLLKSSNKDDILNNIKIIINGGGAISPFMARKLINYFQPPKAMGDLTERETQVLTLLAEGWSYKEVADKVGLSIDGTRYHIRNIYKKLEVNSQSELIKKVNDLKQLE